MWYYAIHPAVTIKSFVNQKRSILDCFLEIKKLFSKRDNIKEKETLGPHWGPLNKEFKQCEPLYLIFHLIYILSYLSLLARPPLFIPYYGAEIWIFFSSILSRQEKSFLVSKTPSKIDIFVSQNSLLRRKDERISVIKKLLWSRWNLARLYFSFTINKYAELSNFWFYSENGG